MLERLAKDASQGIRPVVGSGRLIPFLVEWGYLNWALHKSVGSLPVLIDRSNVTWVIGAISSLSSFNKSAQVGQVQSPFQVSGLAELSVSIPLTEILKASITGVSFSTPDGVPLRSIVSLSAIS